MVRTVRILDRRDLGGKLGPSARAGGVEFEIFVAVLGGYAEEIQSEGMAVTIQVVGALHFGQPRRRRVAVCKDWRVQSRQIRGRRRENQGLECIGWSYDAEGDDGDEATDLHDRISSAVEQTDQMWEPASSFFT